MKLVYIIGFGVGSGSLTGEAVSALSEAQVVIGAPRSTALFASKSHEVFSGYRKSEVDAIVSGSKKTIFALLVSGDTGFYSAAAEYDDCPLYRVRFIPGVSSVNYFFSRCRLPWEKAKLLSAHGQTCGVVSAVRRNRLTFLLTGGNVREIASSLCENGYDSLKVHVGESLGAPDEKICMISVRDLLCHICSPLTVMIIENPSFDKRQRTGIADSAFIRHAGIPMSKSPVRALVMSSLCVAPDSVCWDVGCGTGSVTVEMALAAYEGSVYAIDKNSAATSLTMENCRAFHTGNVSARVSSAPEALESLPAPDRVFIGGSTGKAEGIAAIAFAKNPKARIVITAVSPQSAVAAIDALEALGLNVGITQISAAHGSKKGGMHMMTADNPVYIISGDSDE